MTIQMHPPDEELWQATAAGDEAAFTSLFDRHVRTVYNHAFRLTGSWTLAEDVTQETFPPTSIIGVLLRGSAARR